MSSDEDDIDSIEEEEEEEIIQKPKRRRKKKKKDPNRPKRNMSAFFLYSNANRERVKEENPDARFGDIVSVSFVFLWRGFLVVGFGQCLLVAGRVCESLTTAALEGTSLPPTAEPDDPRRRSSTGVGGGDSSPTRPLRAPGLEFRTRGCRRARFQLPPTKLATSEAS